MTTINSTSFSPFSTWSGAASPLASANSAASPNANAGGATSTNGTGSATSSDGTDQLGSAAGMSLSSGDFMKLFLSELQNQDPTQPVDDSQMLGQLSQMTEVSTLQQVQTSLQGSQLAQASALIGKNVTGQDVNGAKVDGVVTAVTQSNDAGLVLQVGTQYIKPDSVVNVTAPAATTTTTTTTTPTP